MKKLITTTAMVLALSLPIAAFAQSTDTATTTDGGATMGFLASRSQNQMLVSDLMGHDVYARRMPMDANATTAADGATPAMTQADLDNMDNVGQINDFILSTDGSVVAIVIGIGGFLGAGEQDVAVTMDQVSFAADPDDVEDMYIVLNTSGEMLKTSPQFDRAGMAGMEEASEGTDMAATDQTGAAATEGTDMAATEGMAADGTATDGTAATDGTNMAANDGTTATERQRLTAPSMTREGYNTLQMTDVSIDTLIGKTVYGTDDSNVGTVSDVTVDAEGAVQNVIIDFGGFLGIGSTQVALDFDEMTILSDGGNADIRVYVEATQDQIRAMPVYTASN